jgi:hypothetical protein
MLFQHFTNTESPLQLAARTHQQPPPPPQRTVEHALHDVAREVPVLKVAPATHELHTRSALVVQGDDMYWPAGQVVEQAVHVVASELSSLKLVPDTQLSHTRSAVVRHATDIREPIAQV